MKNLIVGIIIVAALILAGNAIIGSFMNTMSDRNATINTVIDKLN